MPTKLNHHSSRYLLLFGIFWLILMVLYRNALHAHFNDDFIAGIKVYLEQGPKGFLTNFDFPSLYYGHNLFFYGFYLLFGLNEYAWHLYITVLHAVNAVLILMVMQSLLQRYHFNNATLTAFVTALFFIASPYQTENVLWCATIHYQIGMMAMLGGILLIGKFVSQQQPKYIYLLYGVFAFSLVTIELTLTFPFVWAITYFLYREDSSRRTVISFATWLFLPCTLLVVVYFTALRLLRGIFVPHYGSEIHLANWSPKIVLECFTKYLIKTLGFIHFTDYSFRDKVYSLCDQTVFLLLFWLAIIMVLAFAYRTRFKQTSIAIVGLLSMAFITLLPSLNMYFMYLNHIENDRLAFMAIPFLYAIPAIIITRFRPWAWLPLTLMVLIVMQYFLNFYINNWVNAAEVQRRTISSFHFEGKKKLYIVNLPVNFDGAYIYRSYWRFPAAVRVMDGKDISKQLEVVAGMNMFDLADRVDVVAIDSITYDITLDGLGWFYNNVHNTDGLGEGYNFTAKDKKCLLHFDKPLRNDEAIIYQDGGYWKEAKKWQPH